MPPSEHDRRQARHRPPGPGNGERGQPGLPAPAGAEETDLADAAVDGTSASHYGANDPALYENSDSTNQD
ncbi:hypothetical protein ACFSC4_22675 [Deinococcus malanensis]|uniref:hypothetical protein n=1 Tax=Deinococcus malanensis TaxID=1706855 RepID=UPI00363CD5A6